ncbi:MAG: tripartite tricarboxylate transporter substrate binding protein, partial [Betaproteobacteria bacterium]|nr:tripartite tricarboxylate transporter substrate binding protein [Betaproteobacteria bacterium]
MEDGIQMTRRSAMGGMLALALGCTAVLTWAAETYPARPVRIVVGFTPGTTTDITARLLADHLAERLGQTVVVENRPGANSGIANQIVGKATADGHTLLLGTLSLVTGPMLYKELPFDPRDFAPVSLVVLAANVICVYPGVPVRSLKELIAQAKSQPGKLRYGSSGRGSSAFLTLELLKSMAGIDLQEIPYKASSQAVADTMGGQIEIYPPNLVSAIPMLKSGRLRPLAVTGAKRSPILPDVPAVSEVVPGYDARTGVYGILVPAG